MDNKSYHDLGDTNKEEDNKDPGSNISSELGRVECINMRGDDNKAVIYTIPEDMTDVFLVFFGTSKKSLSFESNQDVAYKEIFYKNARGTAYSVTCTMFFVPDLKKGTAIPNLNGRSYLVRFKESNAKAGNITKESITGTTYHTGKTLRNVLLLQCGSKKDPTFQEAPGDPIITFKQIALYNHAREPENGGMYYYSLYFIPEFKEYSTITKHTGGVLFY